MDSIWFCASGDSHFLGLSFLILAADWTTWRPRPHVTIFAGVLPGAELLLILMAAIPVLVVFYGAWTFGIVLLLTLPHARKHAQFRIAAQATVVTFAVMALATG